MAKKKTENIKAAPVLRTHGDEQPTPTPEQTGTRTRTYQIMDPWKDRDVVNLVDVKAVDGAVTEVKVNGQPAGGGGTLAGFDIITVTITTTDNSFPFSIGNRVDYDNNGELRGAFIINNNYYVDMSPMISANSTQTFNLLHKSGIAFEVPVRGTPVITGNATYSDNTIHITGDCSITI